MGIHRNKLILKIIVDTPVSTNRNVIYRKTMYSCKFSETGEDTIPQVFEQLPFIGDFSYINNNEE